ncbi:hypothetical protein SNEBB_000573 [Seison nebaliae]|nr:hypothetical protein SNEBB_000573 [Seison nebaliae]
MAQKISKVWKKSQILQKLKEYAPLENAMSFDNVGIMIESSGDVEINKILLTIDLTPPVVREAIEKKCQFIISYHPPIFSGLKSISNSNWQTKLLIRCVESGITVYSPHTAIDALPYGPNEHLMSLVDSFHGISSEKILDEKGIPAGTIYQMNQNKTLNEFLKSLKSHLRIDYIRRIKCSERFDGDEIVKSIGVCVGSGSSSFKLLKQHVDILLTGEMSHHDILSFRHSDICDVILLLEHDVSERHFLKYLMKDFKKLFDNCSIVLAENDKAQIIFK